ncbi:hypothetical protein [Gracilinema caldarium]|uniref:hypothetical protein n=1 Tax=Gracilinema caldarium TaxID=215591 RepID=UPI0002E69B6E|nr:hypothetical protein [Gracilinema caldarium]
MAHLGWTTVQVQQGLQMKKAALRRLFLGPAGLAFQGSASCFTLPGRLRGLPGPSWPLFLTSVRRPLRFNSIRASR